MQAEDQSSSSDKCKYPMPSIASDSAGKHAVALSQHYFEYEGCTEFLSSMQSYFVKKKLKNVRQTAIDSFFFFMTSSVRADAIK